MKYQRTKLDLNDFLAILGKDEDKLTAFDLDAFLFDKCIEEKGMWCDFVDLPRYDYFELEDGRKYVLEYIPDSLKGVVFEVLEDELGEVNPSEYILRDTVSLWDGDSYENLAFYGLDVNPEEASEDAIDVMIWIAFQYHFSAENIPLDRYLTNLDFNPNCINDKDITPNMPYIFSTYSEAQAWIDEQNKAVYHLQQCEVDRPIYTIVE